MLDLGATVRSLFHLAALAALCLAACGSPGPGLSLETAEAPAREGRGGKRREEARPPVLVTIVVDQLAAWVLAERMPLLPKEGGFARLAREGTYVREMRHAHAVTDTAPGHAALFTGAAPRASGIYGNETVDPETGRTRGILRDPRTRLFGPEGPMDTAGSSAEALGAETLADVLRERVPDALIVSVSVKDRGAIFGGGRKPDATLWYHEGEGVFVTSDAFGRRFPEWAMRLGSREALAARRGKPWTLLDPAWVEANAGSPDDAPGEGDWHGLGATFPHRVDLAKRPASAFRATPAADAAVLDLALAALEAEGAKHRPTLLSVSLSANDYVGHVFGPDSWEAWDELRRLDALLAAFFTRLDGLFGPEGYAVLLAADHGTMPMPEARARRPECKGGVPDARDPWQRPCGASGRLAPGSLLTDLRAASRAALGRAPGGASGWVAGIANPYVFLGQDARGLDAPARARLGAAVEKALYARPEVDRVFDVSKLPDRCPPASDDSVEALVCRSVPKGAFAGYYVVLRPGAFFDPEYVEGFGINHGSHRPFDRAVPLLARAPGRVAAGAVWSGPLPVAVFTRTAAALLGVHPPAEAAPAEPLAKGR